MAYKLVKTEGGKTNWSFLRHVFYTGLIVWTLGVRLAGIDPFADVFNQKVTLSTAIDLVALWGLWMLVWFIFYPIRPRFGASNT